MADQAYLLKERLLNNSASRLSLLWNNQGREIVVYNPSSFPVSAVVPIEIGCKETILSYEKTGSGEGLLSEAYWQPIHQGATQVQGELYCPAVPGMSYRRFPLTEAESLSFSVKKDAVQITSSVINSSNSNEMVCLENSYYRAIILPGQGAIASLFDKELQKELVGKEKTFGQLVYVAGGEGTTLMGNRSQYGKPEVFPKRCFPLYSEGEICQVERRTSSYDTRLILQGKGILGWVKIVYILHHFEKKLELIYEYNKEETASIEAVYVDFPTSLAQEAQVFSDSQTGWVDWQKDLLPGACTDWLPLQTSMLLRDKQYQIQIASPDIFLFTVNHPVQGHWQQTSVQGGRLYSYVLNNYWRVNYKASQGGNICFRYGITSSAISGFEQCYQFSQGLRNGLYAQRMSYQEFRESVPATVKDPTGGTFMTCDTDKIAVSTLRGGKANNSILIRLVEVAGQRSKGTIAFAGKTLVRACKTDHQGRQLYEVAVTREQEFFFEMESFAVETWWITFGA